MRTGDEVGTRPHQVAVCRSYGSSSSAGILDFKTCSRVDFKVLPPPVANWMGDFPVNANSVELAQIGFY